MTYKSLFKGFEVELFTGSFSCKNIGVSSEVVKDLPGFVKEPDQRNVEYITAPEHNYCNLTSALINPRLSLREWLKEKDLTILPGSTLSLGDSKQFQRSDPINSYHELIESNYGTNVVTASIHINLGIEDISLLLIANRLVRCEAALFLALSASSPFLDGKVTGVHSQRWIQFPRTPKNVPVFLNHSHYVKWVEEQLNKGIMWNERHLWTSVRPNGPSRPYELNRLELRICDLISNTDLLLAVTALLELRVLSLMNNPNKFDPIQVSCLKEKDLAELSDMNDLLAAQYSLDAELKHWKDGKTIVCRDWIEKLVQDVTPLAASLNMVDLLTPIYDILDKGNQSMQWLQKYSSGYSLESILQESLLAMELEEKNFTQKEAILRG